ncbi:MAG: formate dehydrogenase accessory sulfurtransferase FdhD [Candidatus Limnocylindrales bacterium]
MTTTRKPATRVEVVRDGAKAFDEVITEEPLQIRVNSIDLAVTMRTPGHDFELAAGFLIGEGHVRVRDDIVDVKYCVVDVPRSDGRSGRAQQDYNIVTVTLRGAFDAPARSMAMTAACGLCGKRSIDEVHVQCAVLPPTAPIALDVLLAMPEAMRAHQRLFDRTGGVHAAGLFDRGGAALIVREDIGRHNAADKVIGSALIDGRLPLHDHVLVLSGRASFEMIQKAALAGATTVVAVSAPSSLAVEAADRLGLCLVAFGGNVYAHPERVMARESPD